MKALALVALVGCARPAPPILICHNASCAAGATADEDDTMAALRGSLALRTTDGAVVFDGIELDSVWNRARRRCTFAHEPNDRADDFAAAAALVAHHVASAAPGEAAHGDAFYFKIELKTDVGGADHTPAERAAHVACVTDAMRTVVAAGAASDNRVVAIFDSNDPVLLAAIDPRLGLFETNLGTALPAGFAPQIWTLAWSDYDAAFEPEASDRIAIWSRQPSPGELDHMLARGPAYLVVNNVAEARSLIDAP